MVSEAKEGSRDARGRLLGFFLSGPDRPVAIEDPAELRRVYERMRWSVFLSTTLGYGLFYVCRLNLSVVRGPMLEEGILTATQLGLVGALFKWVYAFGKLTNGFLADRCNIARLMATGLLVSALANIAFGATTSFPLFVLLWGVSGWFQATGSAPSVASISQWFSNRERGTRYGIWSTCHAIGEAITFALTPMLVMALGWRSGFFGPGILCGLAALLLYRTLKDRPQTYGLPPVAVFKGDPAAPDQGGRSIGRHQLDVLRSPAVWVLGLASAALYVARYGINDWGVFYLDAAKGYTLEGAGRVLAAAPLAGIAGAASSGWISDRFFGSRRNVTALIFGLVEIGALAAFYLTPPGHVWVDVAVLAAFGFALDGLLVFVGGLMAVDLCSKRAAGAAMGLIGMFSYFGAATQDVVSGYLIDLGRTVVDGQARFDLDPLFAFWIGASALSIVLTAAVWRAKARD